MKFSHLLRGWTLGIAAAAALGAAGQAGAAWPEQPVRLVVPFAAGGTTDLLGRLMAEGLGAELGQSVVVVNKAGAGGSLGASEVAHAQPDGYTLLLGTPGTQIINAYVYKKIGYDPVKDFAPVAYVAQVPNVVLTHPGSGLKNMDDLLRTARAEPGRLNWGSPGVGSSGHLALEMIKRMGKVDIRHVPYKGASQANNDLLGGQIDLSADNLPTALPLIKAGKLVALGVTSAQPVPAAPGVAAIAQSVPGFELTSWFVVMAPAGTPQAVIDKLNAAAQRVLDAPATRERLATLAAQPIGGTPQALAQHLQTEREKYRVLIEGTDIRPE
ncbi:extra-cytoplasmic solute receptor family protein 178 [Achromobacter xylosoxidans A8]|uniref:Extra-cytoplasmic solute receptor family protein 178 n=1 Tax=Achromobacter xylosoxidans (strain A8) TaxID=762376 RepID=E3HQI1_ACHXA|nr:tripartite tricarboxylate transporter substrate binding protein [Achromobacter xylosoxidans]ADP19615.1 extra-cytoplasmic solute receptor family protein 178 [Achromobacter xylosoxidans A8]